MVTFRGGDVSDLPAVLNLFDDNIEWLVERGREAQWGSQPFTGNEAREDFVRGILESGVLDIAEIDGEVVGTTVLTDHPMPYVEAIKEPERYLKLLIASPEHRGERIGSRLVERARERTVSDGIDLMRVDCWSGGDRRLVAYYEAQGFVPTHEIEVRPGATVQVFEWRAGSAGSSS